MNLMVLFRGNSLANFPARAGFLALVLGLAATGLAAAPQDQNAAQNKEIVAKKKVLEEYFKKFGELHKAYQEEYKWWQEERKQYIARLPVAFDNNFVKVDNEGGTTNYNFRLDFLNTRDNELNKTVYNRRIIMQFSGDSLSKAEVAAHRYRVYSFNREKRNVVIIENGKWDDIQLVTHKFRPDGLENGPDGGIVHKVPLTKMRVENQLKILDRILTTLRYVATRFDKLTQEIKETRERQVNEQGADAAGNFEIIR